MEIKKLETPSDIAKSFNAFVELRPFLNNIDKFVAQVLDQKKQGYEIAAIFEGNEIVACMGFRIILMLARGKTLYIDDLITKEKFRGKGYGKFLLDHAIEIAKDNQCNQVHLDSGYTRYAAHKIYLKHGFRLDCHHFALNL